LYTEICRANDQDSDAWHMLGAVNGMLGLFDEAISCCLRSLEIHPARPDVFFNLAQAYMYTHRFSEAVNAYREVVRLSPDHVDALKNMGNALQAQGLIDDATACYRRALELRPDSPEIHSNLLLSLNYNPAYDAPAIFAEHVRWADLHERCGMQIQVHPNLPDPDRTLRIGYVSPDIRNHSVSYFLEPLLAHHNPAAVTTVCYIDVSAADDTTSRIGALAPLSRHTAGQPDARVAELISKDGIDILVDLAGHTAGNRLTLFARRPAPIQVTYLGYPNTTGLKSMDYRITDEWADPPGKSEPWHTETLVRIPGGFLCYKPPGWAPPVAPPPAIHNGFITFGSFNNLSKVTPGAVELWANILHAVPGSRLLLKSKSFRDAASNERIRGLFASNGIADSRLDLLAYARSAEAHLACYHRMDIALDTFPYNGATTTCEALWMGVPVLSLVGTMHAGRVGVSLLSQAGLTELLAASPDDCVNRAVSLANDEEKRIHLRNCLQVQINNSSLCDGKAFSGKIEAAYRDMWRSWCLAHGK
jgi:predicted O-linked N-acetylglucosamine transferase (SPINDLY family)